MQEMRLDHADGCCQLSHRGTCLVTNRDREYCKAEGRLQHLSSVSYDLLLLAGHAETKWMEDEVMMYPLPVKAQGP